MWISCALGYFLQHKSIHIFFQSSKQSYGIQKRPELFFNPADTFRYPKFLSKRLCILKCLLCLHVLRLPRILVSFRCYRLDTLINLQASLFLMSKILYIVSKQMKRGAICFDSETLKIIPYFPMAFFCLSRPQLLVHVLYIHSLHYRITRSH